MNLGIKFFIYMFLVANCEQDATNTIQVLENNLDRRMGENSLRKVLRMRRQGPVVQPEWTSDGGMKNLFVDYNVRVTEQKLQETEALRDMIQAAIDRDSYAVELSKSDFKNSDVEPNSESDEVSDTINADSEPGAQSEAKSVSISESQGVDSTEGIQPKSKPKKGGNNFPAWTCVFFKKGCDHNPLNNSFAEWLKKLCLPPWCKDGVHMQTSFI